MMLLPFHLIIRGQLRDLSWSLLLTISDKNDSNCIKRLYFVSNDSMALVWGNIVYKEKRLYSYSYRYHDLSHDLN